MTKKARTYAFLVVLGAVGLGVVGYFIWIFLSPPASITPPIEQSTLEVQSGLIEEPTYKKLSPFADLPVQIMNVGRTNPFSDFRPPVINVNAEGEEGADENPEGGLQ